MRIFVSMMMMLLAQSIAHASFITPDVNGCLRIRSQPRGQVRGCVEAGTSLEYIRSQGNWAQVKNNGRIGWVYRPMTRSVHREDHFAKTLKKIPTAPESDLDEVGKIAAEPAEPGTVLPVAADRKITIQPKPATAVTAKPAEPAADAPALNGGENAGGNLRGKGVAIEKAKHRNSQHLANACREIKANKSKHTRSSISLATQYFTPLFQPDRNGNLRSTDRRSCLNVEGSCVVGDRLYNYGLKPRDRDGALQKFGKGNGAGTFNETNALDPCRTVAADQRHHPAGTVLYIPTMEGKICPQTGKPVDGCFIVGDVGKKIRGPNRFDLFTGECVKYNKNNNTCEDKLNNAFVAPSGTTYYIVGRHNMKAKALREEANMHIRNGWITEPFLPRAVRDVFDSVQ